MQARTYNNPMFAQSLAGLVQNLIGDPSKQAAAEEAASRALLNNQTAQYREAIGDTGLSGDLAAMMVRALQAGPQYSGNAPKIGDAAIRMGSLGFGRPELTPAGGIAGLVRSAMTAPVVGTAAPVVGTAAPVVPGSESKPPSAGIGSQSADGILQGARAAIANGKDPNSVAQFLRGMGIDPSQLWGS